MDLAQAVCFLVSARNPADGTACSANNASRVPEQRVLMCGSEVSRYLTAHGSTFGLHAATYLAVERNPDKARLVCSEEVDAFLISLEANGANENA
eukprot:scaffold8234_cov116-Skeletonema_marinoi.AAC.6